MSDDMSEADRLNSNIIDVENEVIGLRKDVQLINDQLTPLVQSLLREVETISRKIKVFRV